ncbi:UDP-glucuronosyltransferase 2A2-like [Nylanderia fulva]|uniref:UDP-glucuronosyltransferase 2A2-like n=1 Tax=Nylanderia fulva TaxID=613905 RepID=UPI0010FBB998|nr:UDP-glucuronosyltransferase 2A2-like [Nylanderia fulva]
MLKSIIIVSILWIIADAARILVVLLEPSYSHQVAYRPIMIELAQRGHELTVFTPIPMNDSSLQNYTEVKLEYSSYKVDEKMDVFAYGKLGVQSILDDFYHRNEEMTDSALSNPVMQQLISPNYTEKFDLVIVEFLFYDAFYALSYRFNAPLIGISSASLLTVHHYAFGNPILWSHLPDLLVNDLDDEMNFIHRFYNAYYSLFQIYWHKYKIIPVQEKMVRKYFGDSVPPAHKLVSNMALLLSNYHPFLSPNPYAQEIIPIRGSRPIITQKNHSLPQDLQKELDDATKGFIYFSLGSNIRGVFLSDERRNMFRKTFEKLPYKIVWKFESDFPDKPNNVIIRNWLPQHEILSHPNIRLFIYQGGLQSTEEAIENGIPMIGFPVVADQYYNIKQLVKYGSGKSFSITDVTEDELRETIYEVITNSSYKENMLKLRNLLHDRPYDELNYAVWWIEHVIRHKGAPHLRNKLRDMPWYKTQLWDIIGFTLLVLLVSVYSLYHFITRGQLWNIIIILTLVYLFPFIVYIFIIIKLFTYICSLYHFIRVSYYLRRLYYLSTKLRTYTYVIFSKNSKCVSIEKKKQECDNIKLKTL